MFEIRVFNDLLVKRGFAHNYSYFTLNHLDYLKTLIHYGQSHYTKIRKMAQSMFKDVFKTSSVLNICGQHLDGRHEQFLAEIISTLESQTAEQFIQNNDAAAQNDDSANDEIVENGKMDVDDPDSMS